MEDSSLLSNFFTASRNDPRIGPAHICLYVSLLQLWKEKGYSSPFLAKRMEVMAWARIAGASTYHRILQDLVEHGYIKYEGRYDRNGSKFTLEIK